MFAVIHVDQCMAIAAQRVAVAGLCGLLVVPLCEFQMLQSSWY
jgi:hypothetical protein